MLIDYVVNVYVNDNFYVIAFCIFRKTEGKVKEKAVAEIFLHVSS